MFKRLLSFLVLFFFLVNTLGPRPAYAQGVADLPVPGTMVNLSPAYAPVLMKGLRVHPENPFKFDFIMDTGNDPVIASEAKQSQGHPERSEGSQQEHLKKESNRLIKYFLTALTVEEKDLWVNLSPYEKNRLTSDNLGKTQMGQDLLAQDYILKQLTASLIYPEKDLGKVFWDKVYAKAQQLYGTTQVPVNTFNKVWIVAERADIFERNNTAYIVGAHLKVMLEEDYLAKEKNEMPTRGHVQDRTTKNVSPSALPSELAVNVKATQGTNLTPNVASQIIREIILPEIEREVNEGKSFAPLRQMFYSMILASWYKMALKDTLINQLYSNQGKVGGVKSDDPQEKEKIFERYLQAYKKGVFNYIKEDISLTHEGSNTTTPRKYFSGGFDYAMLGPGLHSAIHRHEELSPAMTNALLPNGSFAIVRGNADTVPDASASSHAMTTTLSAIQKEAFRNQRVLIVGRRTEATQAQQIIIALKELNVGADAEFVMNSAEVYQKQGFTAVMFMSINGANDANALTIGTILRNVPQWERMPFMVNDNSYRYPAEVLQNYPNLKLRFLDTNDPNGLMLALANQLTASSTAMTAQQQQAWSNAKEASFRVDFKLTQELQGISGLDNFLGNGSVVFHAIFHVLPIPDYINQERKDRFLNEVNRILLPVKKVFEFKDISELEAWARIEAEFTNYGYEISDLKEGILKNIARGKLNQEIFEKLALNAKKFSAQVQLLFEAISNIPVSTTPMPPDMEVVLKMQARINQALPLPFNVGLVLAKQTWQGFPTEVLAQLLNEDVANDPKWHRLFYEINPNEVNWREVIGDIEAAFEESPSFNKEYQPWVALKAELASSAMTSSQYRQKPLPFGTNGNELRMADTVTLSRGAQQPSLRPLGAAARDPRDVIAIARLTNALDGGKESTRFQEVVMLSMAAQSGVQPALPNLAIHESRRITSQPLSPTAQLLAESLNISQYLKAVNAVKLIAHHVGVSQEQVLRVTQHILGRTIDATNLLAPYAKGNVHIDMGFDWEGVERTFLTKDKKKDKAPTKGMVKLYYSAGDYSFTIHPHQWLVGLAQLIDQSRDKKHFIDFFTGTIGEFVGQDILTSSLSVGSNGVVIPLSSPKASKAFIYHESGEVKARVLLKAAGFKEVIINEQSLGVFPEADALAVWKNMVVIVPGDFNRWVQQRLRIFMIGPDGALGKEVRLDERIWPAKSVYEGESFTPDQLKSWGLNPRQIKSARFSGHGNLMVEYASAPVAGIKEEHQWQPSVFKLDKIHELARMERNSHAMISEILFPTDILNIKKAEGGVEFALGNRYHMTVMTDKQGIHQLLPDELWGRELSIYETAHDDRFVSFHLESRQSFRVHNSTEHPVHVRYKPITDVKKLRHTIVDMDITVESNDQEDGVLFLPTDGFIEVTFNGQKLIFKKEGSKLLLWSAYKIEDGFTVGLGIDKKLFARLLLSGLSQGEGGGLRAEYYLSSLELLDKDLPDIEVISPSAQAMLSLGQAQANVDGYQGTVTVYVNGRCDIKLKKSDKVIDMTTFIKLLPDSSLQEVAFNVGQSIKKLTNPTARLITSKLAESPFGLVNAGVGRSNVAAFARVVSTAMTANVFSVRFSDMSIAPTTVPALNGEELNIRKVDAKTVSFFTIKNKAGKELLTLSANPDAQILWYKGFLILKSGDKLGFAKFANETMAPQWISPQRLAMFGPTSGLRAFQIIPGMVPGVKITSLRFIEAEEKLEIENGAHKIILPLASLLGMSRAMTAKEAFQRIDGFLRANNLEPRKGEIQEFSDKVERGLELSRAQQMLRERILARLEEAQNAASLRRKIFGDSAMLAKTLAEAMTSEMIWLPSNGKEVNRKLCAEVWWQLDKFIRNNATKGTFVNKVLKQLHAMALGNVKIHDESAMGELEDSAYDILFKKSLRSADMLSDFELKEGIADILAAVIEGNDADEYIIKDLVGDMDRRNSYRITFTLWVVTSIVVGCAWLQIYDGILEDRLKRLGNNPLEEIIGEYALNVKKYEEGVYTLEEKRMGIKKELLKAWRITIKNPPMQEMVERWAKGILAPKDFEEFKREIKEMEKSGDKAQVTLPTGGIDLDQGKMQMNVSREEGQAAASALTIDPAMIERLKRDGIDSLEFNIETIVPLANLPQFLSLRPDELKEQLAGA